MSKKSTTPTPTPVIPRLDNDRTFEALKPREPGVYNDIPLDRVLILDDAKASPIDVAWLDGFAERILNQGQLTPAIVMQEPDKGRYVVVDGRNRTRALRLRSGRGAGQHLYAYVLPVGWERGSDMGEAYSRAAEVNAQVNLDREPVTPLDEALQVRAVLDQCGGDADLAAQRLGRSATWIRDRGYLSKLGGKARRFVDEGILPLNFAREIAKLGDEDEQSAAACHALHIWSGERLNTESGYRLRPFDQVQRFVSERMRSLKSVPWRLDVEFAGKLACSTCPHNTDANASLFDHDKPTERPDKAYCTNRACFEHKEKAAAKLVQLGVEKVKKARKGEKEMPVTEKALTDRALVPEVIRPAAFARAAQREIRPPEPKTHAAAGGNKPKVVRERSAKEIAEEKLEEATRKWGVSVGERIVKALVASPRSLCVFAALCEFESLDELIEKWNRPSAKDILNLSKEPVRGILADLLDPKPETIERAWAIAAKNGGGYGTVIEKAHDLHDEMLAAVAGALKLDIDIRPKLEDFLPKEAPTPTPSAPGKKKAKKAGKGVKS